MKATFLDTEGDYLLATIKIGDREFKVMDEFGGDRYKEGELIDVELMNSFADEESWEDIFSSNPNEMQALERKKNWEYFAYGKILAINPVVCDCGGIELEAPIETNDATCINDFIGFKVTRLTAFAT